ncbi:hypothetical protein, conserved [Eimeria praecox]|uniref:Uncharacterized protein n=1 Tax=Eimeria praecox TaxID=51316 RepID=U6H5K1_9EIME|nr:hypothetical protein, conserved [Eimeria praecox]
MILRLATLDLAVFVRVPSDIQVHRSELGSAIHDLASELLSYTLRLGMSSTAFLQGLHTFAGLIKDIDAARHEATSSSQDKDLREMGAHAKVCKTALMYYGAVLDGLLWATAAFPVEQTAVLVEQQLRVLQALCTMRAVQVSRDKACRILVFFHQTQRQFRPLVDIGTMKPRDKRWRTVPFTCLELDEAVARGGGVFFPPPPGMLRDAVQPWVVPSGPGGQANEELHATSGATDAHAARVYYAEFPPSLQGQDVSTLMQGAISYTSAELGGTLTAQATQRRQPNTSSAGQLSPSVARRWSRQRYKTAQTYPSLLESPQKGHSNPSVD